MLEAYTKTPNNAESVGIFKTFHAAVADLRGAEAAAELERIINAAPKEALDQILFNAATHLLNFVRPLPDMETLERLEPLTRFCLKRAAALQAAEDGQETPAQVARFVKSTFLFYEGRFEECFELYLPEFEEKFDEVFMLWAENGYSSSFDFLVPGSHCACLIDRLKQSPIFADGSMKNRRAQTELYRVLPKVGAVVPHVFWHLIDILKGASLKLPRYSPFATPAQVRAPSPESPADTMVEFLKRFPEIDNVNRAWIAASLSRTLICERGKSIVLFWNLLQDALKESDSVKVAPAEERFAERLASIGTAQMLSASIVDMLFLQKSAIGEIALDPEEEVQEAEDFRALVDLSRRLRAACEVGDKALLAFLNDAEAEVSARIRENQSAVGAYLAVLALALLMLDASSAELKLRIRSFVSTAVSAMPDKTACREGFRPLISLVSYACAMQNGVEFSLLNKMEPSPLRTLSELKPLVDDAEQAAWEAIQPILPFGRGGFFSKVFQDPIARIFKKKCRELLKAGDRQTAAAFALQYLLCGTDGFADWGRTALTADAARCRRALYISHRAAIVEEDHNPKSTPCFDLNDCDILAASAIAGGLSLDPKAKAFATDRCIFDDADPGNEYRRLSDDPLWTYGLAARLYSMGRQVNLESINTFFARSQILAAKILSGGGTALLADAWKRFGVQSHWKLEPLAEGGATLTALAFTELAQSTQSGRCFRRKDDETLEDTADILPLLREIELEEPNREIELEIDYLRWSVQDLFGEHVSMPIDSRILTDAARLPGLPPNYPAVLYSEQLFSAWRHSDVMLLEDEPGAAAIINHSVGVVQMRSNMTKAPWTSLEMRIPTSFLDTEEGREWILAAMQRLECFGRRLGRELVSDPGCADCALFDAPVFKSWKPFGASTVFVFSHAALEDKTEPENTDLDDWEWDDVWEGVTAGSMTASGDKRLRRTEVMLLTDDEAAYLRRCMTAPKMPRRFIPKASSFRFIGEPRKPVIDIREHGMSDALLLPSGLPKALGQCWGWADRHLLDDDLPVVELWKLPNIRKISGEAGNSQALAAESEVEDSGWLFLSQNAVLGDLKRLTLSEIASLVPQAGSILMNPPTGADHWCVHADGTLEAVEEPDTELLMTMNEPSEPTGSAQA